MEGYYTGRVSSVDAVQGFVKVTYPQENNVVSDWLPLLSFEYQMPEIGALVATLLDKDLNGVCFGKVFSYGQPPKASSGYKKTIDDVTITKNGDTFEINFGNAYVKYSGGTLHVKANDIILDGYTPPANR